MAKSVIHTEQFILIEVDKKTGIFSLPSVKTVYPTYPVALHAAQELASYNPDFKYIVSAVAAVCEVRPVEVPIVTSYRL